MKISVYGAGYVGLVTGVCLASLGHKVCCADINQARIKMLKNGVSPIYEKGLPELLKLVVEQDTLCFTASPKDAVRFSNIHFIATGTPSLPNGQADLSQVFSVVDLIVQESKNDGLIITKSTVPVGTGEEIESRIHQLTTDNKLHFHVASNPEFLREGSAVFDFLNADRIICGGDDDSLELISKIYTPLIEKGIPFVTMSRTSAELTKYASNAMLACRISFMNQMSSLAESLGADIESIREGIGLDHRIGPYFLNAGIGYGGSCFPKDSRALIHKSKSLGIDSCLLESVERINQKQKKWAFNQVHAYFKGDLKDKSIIIWGLSFKPGTDDMREASSVVIITALLEAGAIVHAYDPVAIESAKQEIPHPERVNWHLSRNSTLACEMDALIIVTEWDEFKTIDLADLSSKIKSAPLIDGRNCFELNDIERSGLNHYVSVGRPAVSNKQKD